MSLHERDSTIDKPLGVVFKPEVRSRTGLSDSTIWRKMRESSFPLSLDIGGRTAWYEDKTGALRQSCADFGPR